MLRIYLLLLLTPLLLFSCEKPEKALELPPPTGASHVVLDLGARYERQIFFDFKTGREVHTSDPKSWHLAFESGADQRHIFMNGGGQKVYIHNTHETDLDAVTALPSGLYASGTGWTYDMPCGMSDSTAIGDWFRADGSSKGEVYVLQYGLAPEESLVYLKLRILGLEGNRYSFEWAPLETRGAATRVSLTKDTVANFSYFSFKTGQVFPEPAKETWDIVFTRYRHIYRNYQGIPQFPYEVTGVLSNPRRTFAVPDSLSGFQNITRAIAQTKTPSPFRDAIGFEWKKYDGGTYIVKRMNCFIAWTRYGEIYKLHFLDYRNGSGDFGSPLMEYQRLQ